MARRNVLIASAIGLGLAATAGCSSGSSSSTGSSGGGAASVGRPVVLGLASAPVNLDFRTNNGIAISYAVLDNIYEGLVKLDARTGKIVPDLAKSWTVSNDNKTYDFKLRDGVKYSNGDAFTANNVKYSIDQVKSSAWTISIKSYMDVVKSVDVVSPTEVRVNLSKPNNDWLYYMTGRIGAMFDSKAMSNLKTTAIGTGPYTLQSYQQGQQLVLAANPHYWGGKRKTPNVTFKYYSDANAENAALQSGQINAIVTEPSLDALSQFKGNSNFDIQTGTTTDKMVLSMNNKSGPFKNIKLRQAVEYAINRPALVKNGANGYGKITGSFVPPTDPWYQDLSGQYPYNPAKAKQLIKEAGMKGKSITFDVPNLPLVTNDAQIVQSDLNSVGLNVKINTIPMAQWLPTVFQNGNYQMSIIDHVEQRDLPTYADPTYYWGYDNKKVQQLISTGEAGTAAEQAKDWKQAMQIISNDAVSDWLYLTENVNVVQKGITGLPSNMVTESLDLSNLQFAK